MHDLAAAPRLEDAAREIRDIGIRALFEREPDRARRCTVGGAGLRLDHSKHLLTREALGHLLDLAAQAGLRERIAAMFGGEPINTSEDRAALHVALRAPRDAVIAVEGRNVVPDVHEVLDRMSAFAARIRDGRHVGHTGRRIRANARRAL